MSLWSRSLEKWKKKIKKEKQQEILTKRIDIFESYWNFNRERARRFIAKRDLIFFSFFFRDVLLTKFTIRKWTTQGIKEKRISNKNNMKII